MTASGDPYREWDAAYVLGALSPGERREFVEHLAGCGDCRAAVTELAGVPGLLAWVPPDQALAAAPAAPDGPATSPGDAGDEGAVVVPFGPLVAAARRSRARRRTLAAVAASALLVVGVGAGLALGGRDGAGEPGPAASSPAPVAQTAAADLEPVGAADVHASLAATAEPWGTRLEWSCTYPSGAGAYDPEEYALLLVDAAGSRTVAATWSGSGTSSTGLTAASSLPLDDIVRVEIAQVGGETLSSAAL